MKYLKKVGQDAFVTCGSKLWHASRKLIAGGLVALTSGVLLNMASEEHGYFRPLVDVSLDDQFAVEQESKNSEEVEDNAE